MFTKISKLEYLYSIAEIKLILNLGPQRRLSAHGNRAGLG